jgi:hypothetical protein
VLDRVLADDTGLQFYWSGGQAPDLDGFRVYESTEPPVWSVKYDEALIGPDQVSFADPSAPVEATFYFVAAVDTVRPPNESLKSDVYGASLTGERHILIVDGFDRTEASGSWHDTWHDFAADHGESLGRVGFGFSSATNEAVREGRVGLTSYDAVFWVLGDESTRDETFSEEEQARVKAYLESGGRLFVSGSEIAWDLGARGTPSDVAFLGEYLKVGYQGDDAGILTARGVPGSIFDGLRSFSYGSSPYEEDWPDYFTAGSGAVAAMTYGNGNLVAGIQYAGPFGASSAEGRLVVLGFPFETIGSAAVRDEIVDRVTRFFFPSVVGTDAPDTPDLQLMPAHPNPFAWSTTMSFSLPHSGRARLSVFDVLGRRLAVLADEEYPAGVHHVSWGPSDVAAGVYLFRIEFAGESLTGRVVRAR